MDPWEIATQVIKFRLQLLDKNRKFCAVCGSKTQTKLIPCIRCKMIYYCGKEHRNADYLTHSSKCIQLQLAAVGEIALCLPAIPPFPKENQFWNVSVSSIKSWSDWHSLRPEIITTARETAAILHATIATRYNFELLLRSLLALVTDYLSYPLSLGNAIKVLHGSILRKFCIHIIYSPDFFYIESVDTMKSLFNELSNMFAETEVIHLSFFGPDLPNALSIANEDRNNEGNISNTSNDSAQRLYITFNKKFYDCKHCKYEKPLMVCCFNPNIFEKPGHLDYRWKRIINELLEGNVTLYFTFSKENDYEKALKAIAAFDAKLIKYGLNPFSSQMIKQDQHAPNLVYSINRFHLMIQPFKIQCNRVTRSIGVNENNSFDRKAVNNTEEAEAQVENELIHRRKSNVIAEPLQLLCSKISKKVIHETSSGHSTTLLNPKRRSLRSIKARHAKNQEFRSSGSLSEGESEQYWLRPMKMTASLSHQNLNRFSNSNELFSGKKLSNGRLSIENDEKLKPVISIEEIRKELSEEAKSRGSNLLTIKSNNMKKPLQPQNFQSSSPKTVSVKLKSSIVNNFTGLNAQSKKRPTAKIVPFKSNKDEQESFKSSTVPKALKFCPFRSKDTKLNSSFYDELSSRCLLYKNED